MLLRSDWYLSPWTARVLVGLKELRVVRKTERTLRKPKFLTCDWKAATVRQKFVICLVLAGFAIPRYCQKFWFVFSQPKINAFYVRRLLHWKNKAWSVLWFGIASTKKNLLLQNCNKVSVKKFNWKPFCISNRLVFKPRRFQTSH